MSISYDEFDVKKVLSIIAENEDIKKYDIEIINGNATGENYSAIILFATIKGLKPDNSKATLKVFIKHPPNLDALRKSLKVETTFENETVIYTTLIPELYKLQDSVNMDPSGRFKVPRILKASYEYHNEYIALEDISANGYQKFDRLTSLDYDHLRLLIRKLANFHGTMFAFKTFERKTYNKLTERISEDLFYSLKGTKEVVLLANESLKFAKTFIDQPEEIKAIDKVLDDFPKRMDYLTSRKGAEPYDVICHGDCWISNFWFKYEKEVPKDVCFFDWQLIRCGSLFTDLHYMIFLCTDGETRKKYQKDIFDWYYSDLEEVVEKFGLDINNIYPRDAFKSDERKFAPHALAVALSYSLFMTADPTNLPSVVEATSGNVDRIRKQLTKLTDKGKQRIKEIITDYVSYGYD